jgi:hypothetical protein
MPILEKRCLVVLVKVVPEACRSALAGRSACCCIIAQEDTHHFIWQFKNLNPFCMKYCAYLVRQSNTGMGHEGGRYCGGTDVAREAHGILAGQAGMVLQN